MWKQVKSMTNCSETATYIESSYVYERSVVSDESEDGVDVHKVTVQNIPMNIRTDKRLLSRLGVMFVGLGGNNASSLVAMQLANKCKAQWRTRNGIQKANYYGSLTQSSTLYVGFNERKNEPVYTPFQSFLPMINADDLIFGGWDINKANLYDAAKRAKVFDPEMLDIVRDELKLITPLPAHFDVDFVNANQEQRCDNLIDNIADKSTIVEHLRNDIRKFKQENQCDGVIVVWMANTERFSDVKQGLNMNEEELHDSLSKNKAEISPSTIYGIAAISENCPYINGSPQNTFVPGLIEMAKRLNIPIVGDDLKTGQTKLKSVLVEFLVSAGMKPLSIVSYNHLGNNDGMNLSAIRQFRSKEVSIYGLKSNAAIVDDAIQSNPILFPSITTVNEEQSASIDHCIVIKYVPAVGDSKRAMDEYYSEIGCGGRHTLAIHNTCEDSILAAPLILDLIVLTELFARMTFSLDERKTWSSMHPIFSILSYLCKAPLVPTRSPVINGLFSQRACIENLIRAAIGLNPVNHLGLEFKIKQVYERFIGDF